MKEIEEANKDTQPLNSKNIINLTTKYINTHIMDDLNDDTNTNNNWYSYQYEEEDEEDEEIEIEEDEEEDEEEEIEEIEEIEEDEELINIEFNKYNFYYYENNLDFLSTIALLYAYKKI
jgi:hypothetical protein